MKKYMIGALAIMLISSLNAQNINKVPNGSFEDNGGKVKGPGEIMEAIEWYSAEDTPPADLFIMDNRKEEVSAPMNYRGRCEPLDGKAYAGIRAYSERDREPRQFIQAKMDKKLIEGKKYCVKMSVSLSDLSNTGINKIGLLLSSKGVDADDIAEDNDQPQLLPYDGAVIAEIFEWTTYCTTYVADGTERYVTIGAFEMNDDNIEKEKVRRPREFRQPQSRDAYYYIDDVSVIAVGHLDEPCDCKPKNTGAPKLDVVYKKSVSSSGNESDVIENKVLHYDENVSALDANQKSDLDEIASLMKEDDNIKIEVIGHSDSKENSTLADDRAKAIYTFLATDKGVDASRISYKGAGSSDPASEGTSPAEMAQNRRVEFKIVD